MDVRTELATATTPRRLPAVAIINLWLLTTDDKLSNTFSKYKYKQVANTTRLYFCFTVLDYFLC